MGLSICHWLETYAVQLGLDLRSSDLQETSGHGGFNAVHSQAQATLNQAILAPEAQAVPLMRGIAARVVQELQINGATLFDIAVLAEVLAYPFPQARRLMQPTALVTAHVLRQASRRRPLRRSEGTWLSFQIAYLRALDDLLTQEDRLHRPWLDAARVSLGAASIVGHALSPTDLALPALTQDEEPAHPPLRSLLDTLRPPQLTDTQAEQALMAGTQSLLVQQIRQVLVAWFMFHGTEEREAQLLVQRLEQGLAGYLLGTIAETATPLAQRQHLVRLGNLAAGSSGRSDDGSSPTHPSTLPPFPIDPQRELYRAHLLQSLNEPILGQIFSLHDIYLPLKGQPLPDQDHLTSRTPPPLTDAMTWAIGQLKQPEQIAILEGESGQGKTSFCQMFAVRLAQELYPLWMPILIPLQGLQLGTTLEDTLAPVLPSGLFTEQQSWLSPLHPPCVLILDGLDELPLTPDGEGPIARFLSLVLAFQRRHRDQTTGLPRHRLLLTAHSQTIDTLLQTRPELTLQMRFQRLRLLPLDQVSLKQWFINWATLQTKSIAQDYFNFLKRGGAFLSHGAPAVAPLVHRPLPLLLMALLHRDGFLDDGIFGLSRESAHFDILDRFATWLLGPPTDVYPQPGIIPDLARLGPAHASRSPDNVANLLAGRSPRLVRQQIQTVALQILQNGCAQLPRTSPHDPSPLSRSQPLPPIYFRTLNRSHSLNRPLSTSAHSPVSEDNHLLVFASPTFGNYICGQAIAIQLQQLTDQIQTAYGPRYDLDREEAIAQHLYPLLGHSILSPDVIQLLLEQLKREQHCEPRGIDFTRLCDQLYRFYRFYCRGRWLDEGIAQTTYQTLRSLGSPLSLLQIDAATGLNLFRLLCACYRLTKRPFWPCGNPNDPTDFNPNRLLQLIGRASALAPLAFWENARNTLAGTRLPRTCLNQMLLADANLQQADLSEASLAGTNLERANLQGADLGGSRCPQANFRNANLQGANLHGADLRGANLLGANLKGANLGNACLVGAQLDSEGQFQANQTGAFFGLSQFYAYQGLLQEEARRNEFQSSLTPPNDTVPGDDDRPHPDLTRVALLDTADSSESEDSGETLIATPSLAQGRPSGTYGNAHSNAQEDTYGNGNSHEHAYAGQGHTNGNGNGNAPLNPYGDSSYGDSSYGDGSGDSINETIILG